MRSIIPTAPGTWFRLILRCLWASLALPFMAAGATLPPPLPVPPKTTLPITPQSSTECAIGKILSFVAHPDDDLLFMNPDQDDAIRQGQCVYTVYLTAGDRGDGMAY